MKLSANFNKILRSGFKASLKFSINSGGSESAPQNVFKTLQKDPFGHAGSISEIKNGGHKVRF